MSYESLTKCTGAASALTIWRADVADLDQLTPLFDAYRLFYQQPPDSVAARRFLQQRIERDESIIFLAARDGSALGFMQLYPVFSSTALRVYGSLTIYSWRRKPAPRESAARLCCMRRHGLTKLRRRASFFAPRSPTRRPKAFTSL